MKPCSLRFSSSYFNLKTMHVNTIKMGWRRGPWDPLYFFPFLMWSSNKSVCHHYSALQLAYWEQAAEPSSGRGWYWTQSSAVKTNNQTKLPVTSWSSHCIKDNRHINFVCVYVYVFACLCMLLCQRSENNHGLSSSWMPLTTFETGSLIVLYSPICLDCLASNVQGSSYICFPSVLPCLSFWYRHRKRNSGLHCLFSKRFNNWASPSVHRVPQADLKFMIPQPLPRQHLLTHGQDAQSIKPLVSAKRK